MSIRATSKEVRSRVITAVVMLVIVFFCLQAGGIVFNAFMLVVIFVAAYETQKLVMSKHDSLIFPTVILAVILILLSQAVNVAFFPFVWFSLCALCLTLLFYRHNNSNPVIDALAFILLVGSFYSIVFLRLSSEDGFEKLIFLSSVVIGCDVCAYLVGRTIGGLLLAPSLSPGKTFSGLAGGIAGAGIVGMTVANLLDAVNLSFAVLLYCFMIALFAQMFDLLESALKRYAGEKDSGKILPGHGGVLDRIDGMIGMAVVAGLFYWLGWDEFLWRGR